MKGLTADQIVSLHSQLIEATGGLDGVRDKGLVASSLLKITRTWVRRHPHSRLKFFLANLKSE